MFSLSMVWQNMDQPFGSASLGRPGSALRISSSDTGAIERAPEAIATWHRWRWSASSPDDRVG